jgi:hypothetical protein
MGGMCNPVMMIKHQNASRWRRIIKKASQFKG